LICPKRLT